MADNMGKAPQRRNAKYTDVLQVKAEWNAAELLSSYENPDDAYRAAYSMGETGLDDRDIWTIWGMESRGGLHFDEACDLIAALEEAPATQDSFVIFVKETYGEDDRVQKRIVLKSLTRAELIARLEWISNLDFGDDLAEWLEWREIRAEEGFWSMR